MKYKVTTRKPLVQEAQPKPEVKEQPAVQKPAEKKPSAKAKKS